MVAVAVAIIALAAPTGGLSLAVAGALGVSAAVASAIITVTLSMAASLAFRALGVGAPKPSSQGAGPPQVFRQSISNSFIVYGQRRVGGLLVFFHGVQVGDDHFRYFVIAHAGHHCDSLVDWMFNDEIVTVDGSGMVTSGKYANAAWLWFQDGDASVTANATFVSECGGKWTTNHKGNGICATYAKFEMTEDVVQAGMPNITAIIRGKDDIVDPRGPSTGYSNNAALVFYDYMAMPREEGGFGAYADEIPDDAWISAQANVCDEVVNSLPRYCIDAVIQTGAPPSEIRDLMVVTQAGSHTYSGGKHLMRPGYYVPPTETFGEDDFAGALQVSPFLPGDVVANEIHGTYISPDDNYQGMPFATQVLASPPTDVRQMDLDFAFITNKHQAERVARIMLNRAQAEKTVTVPLNIEGLRAKALDTITLDTARYGLSNYAWQVTGWGLSSDWGVVLALREENADIYDAPTPVAPPSVPAVTVPDPLGGPINPALIPTVAEVEDAAGGLMTDTATIDFTYTPNVSITADIIPDGTRNAIRNGCMVRKAADQTTANYVGGAVMAFDQEVYDDDGWHDNATNNSRLTVPSGVERVTVAGNVRVNNITPPDKVRIQIFKNGAVGYDGQAVQDVPHTAGTAMYISATAVDVPCTAGDYFELQLNITTDTSVTITAAQTSFAIKAS